MAEKARLFFPGKLTQYTLRETISEKIGNFHREDISAEDSAPIIRMLIVETPGCGKLFGSAAQEVLRLKMDMRRFLRLASPLSASN